MDKPDKTSITISVANPTDLDVVSDMQHRLWEHEGSPSNDPFCDPDTTYTLLANLLVNEDKGVILVARDQSRRVVGCIIAAVEMTATGRDGETGGLWVEHGMPLRTSVELVRAAACWYEAAGIETVRVTLSQTTPRGERSRKFHEHIGFRPEAIILRAQTSEVIKNLEEMYNGWYRKDDR